MMASSPGSFNPVHPDTLARAAALALPDTQGFLAGSGPRNPRLLVIGEAPGQTEVEQFHRPFSGRAGVKLDLMLEALGLTRDEVFFAMSLHRRPTKVKNNRTYNRAPTKAEMLAEGFLLDEEIASFPQVPLLLMGNTALWRLHQGRVKDWHGQVLTAPINVVQAGQLVAGPTRRFGVTNHPAALLYRGQTQVDTLADLAAMRTKLLEENF